MGTGLAEPTAPPGHAPDVHTPDPAGAPADATPGATAFQPDRFAAWVARALTGKRVRCEAVTFERDGHLALRLASDRESVTLRLGPRAPDAPTPAHPLRVGLLHPATDEDAAKPWPAFARYVATRLDQVVARFHVPAFDLFRLDEPDEVFSFEPGLFSWRIRDLLVPGVTRYGPYVYAGEHFDGRSLRHRFESARATVALRLDITGRERGGDAGASDEPTFATRHLTITTETDERTPAERADPAHQVERYLGFLVSLCDPPSARYGLRHRTEAIVVGSTQDWGADLSVQFFADPGFDFLANFYAAFGLRWPIALLFHGERECSHMGTYTPAPLTNFVEHPMHVRPPEGMAGRVFASDVAEADMALGSEERLKEALRAVGSRPDIEAVVVQDTCVVRVVGDDIRRCIAEVQPEVPAPLLYLDATAMDEAAPFAPIVQFWQDVLERTATPRAPAVGRRETPPEDPAAAGADPETAGRVNLVGFGQADDAATAELTALLARVGVTTNAALFPGIGRDEARRFLAAAANVVTPWEYVRQSFVGIEAWSGLPTVVPPLPFGRAGTRAFLGAVREAVAGDPGADGAVPDMDERQRARFAALRDHAGRLEAGVVFVSTQAARVLAPERALGVPLLALLADLGFAVRALCFDPPRVRGARERTAPEDIDAALRAALPPDAAFAFETFADAAALPARLAGPGLDLVYSEIRDDPRLAAAGKAQVGVSDLEMGYEGAIRTVERLVRRARNPFGRRYARYLGRAAHERADLEGTTEAPRHRERRR